MFGLGGKKALVGLDIGSSSIKAVEVKDLGRGKGYALKSLGMEYLPPEVIVRTQLKYLDAYRRLTGTELP